MLLDWICRARRAMSFLRQLRNERRTKQIPVIMLTAHGEFDKVPDWSRCRRLPHQGPSRHRELLLASGQCAPPRAVARREPIEFSA